MLRFFHQIRIKLLSQNRIARYLLYALGELLLVVMGILIALQVNNWNEERTNRIKEKTILLEILNDLEVAKADLENDVQSQIESLKKAEKLKNHLLDNKAFSDSVRLWMVLSSSNTQFTPRTSGYKNLQSVGLDIIQNDSLRKEIVSLFDVRFNYLISIGKDFDRMTNPTLEIEPFLKKHFMIDLSYPIIMRNEEMGLEFETDYVQVRDYESLKNDSYYISALQKTVYDRFSKINRFSDAKINIENIIKNIKRTIADD